MPGYLRRGESLTRITRSYHDCEPKLLIYGTCLNND